ncbi:MAG: polysaccharide biosynthesis/export family protein [Gemmatimonadetes bacterium]|nr:polysaccharide biosynthesis/export family protein [Gemmatimonadota bacterium]
MRRTRSVLALATLLALTSAAGCGGRQSPPASTVTPIRPADTSASARLAIRPGDVIKIQVWGHEELSGEFPIDENDNLQFPIVGEINVREMSVAQLRDRLRQELSQLFTQTYVTIIPLFRVAVLGEVVRPGLYSVDATLTVFDLLALAGGPTRSAREREMGLIRAGEQIRVSIEPAAVARATLRELGIRSGDQLIVPRQRITREDLGLILTAANLVLIAYSIFR